jgi:KUP system potassium uptake protein
MSDATTVSTHDTPARLRTLAVAALGVVFGDIGTSPLYAIKECVGGTRPVPATPENILGIVSLIIWALILVVSIKYVWFILKADHQGEGGVLALLARAISGKSGRSMVLIALGLFGAALLYGDGVITPAISVLSAVEGLDVATLVFHSYVPLITAIILALLFLVQRHGTGGVGRVFGPAMLVWFAAIAALGARWIFIEPRVLAAFSPHHAVRFLSGHGLHGVLILGAVVLCITGTEALYADMGHFGRRPIRLTWSAVVFPAVLLNYLGQGAGLLALGDRAVGNPFYALVPRALLYPMVAVATVATIIASQALISGAYSLTRQAIQLGYLPRTLIVHTSRATEGQIYLPQVNALLMVACLATVLAFRSSSNLAAAYGVAVTGTMSITSILFFVVMRERWGTFATGALTTGFLIVDLGFLLPNLAKVPSGGWFPLVIAVGLLAVMLTWKRGRAILQKTALDDSLPLDLFVADVAATHPLRPAGSAVFLSLNPRVAPPALLHNFKHNRVVHERVIILSITNRRVPHVAEAERLEVEDFGEGFYQVVASYGFMESPDVPDLIERLRAQGIPVTLESASFFISRETLLLSGRSGLARWRGRLFAFLAKNAHSPASYFGLPANRVVEMGKFVEI